MCLELTPPPGQRLAVVKARQAGECLTSVLGKCLGGRGPY